MIPPRPKDKTDKKDKTDNIKTIIKKIRDKKQYAGRRLDGNTAGYSYRRSGRA